MKAQTPEYFDYLHEHGQFLADRFGIQCEEDSLEADIAHYRRRQSNEKRYWHAAVYLRKLVEQMTNTLLEVSQLYDYSREMLGKKLRDGIKDGLIPLEYGYCMVGLNNMVRDGAHAGEYSRSHLEAAFIQLDETFRAILKYEGKSISGDKVGEGSVEVLLAHSDSIEGKAALAAQLTGNARLVEESRAANKRAIAAERDARFARKKEEAATKENEQLRLELENALQTIVDQKATLSKKEAAYAKAMQNTEQMSQLMDKLIAKADARSMAMKAQQKESDARLNEAQELRVAKEAAVDEAAERVSEFEEHLDSILNEHDFIRTLLEKTGKATEEQRRVVNFTLDPTRKRRVLKVTGKAGTGKTLCLLAAVINYLEPHGQGSMAYGSQATGRRALFVCYNKDLARYIKGLLEGFPGIREQIEVANYDQFLNQLIRTSPVEGYKHLSGYARDVRHQPLRDSNGYLHYWDLVVEKNEKIALIRQSIAEIRNYYQNNGMQVYCKSAYLNDDDDSNVSWMTEEVEWLEGRYHDIEEGRIFYPSANRIGRGVGRRPAKNSVERTHIINVWIAYYNILKSKQLYTFNQTVSTLLKSRFLPIYNIVAIDEAQDLNMMHIELFLRFKAEGGYLLIAGDEGQRIYPRDFTWRQVDSNIKPITMTLSSNKRNPVEIQQFAERLDASEPFGRRTTSNVGGAVQVRHESKEATVSYVKELASRGNETTAIVSSDLGEWGRLLRNEGIATETSKDFGARGETIRMSDGHVRPGIYCFTQLKTKGLEFDNVIIDYDCKLDAQDERRERRIRYMQFTRARKTLLIRYEGEVPELIQKHYPDYLE